MSFRKGDFTAADQAQLTAGRPHVHFIEMTTRYWSLPAFLNESDVGTWLYPKFAVGYRHMVRCAISVVHAAQLAHTVVYLPSVSSLHLV